MISEITYAEVWFKNESKSSDTKSEHLAAPKEKTNLYKGNPGFSKVFFVALLILLLLLTISFFVAFIIFFQKYSQLHKEKKTLKEFTHTALECMKENLTMEVNSEKDWSCCPRNWKPFSLNCYFISTKTKNWIESEKNCSGMNAHLLVINTKDEKEFITVNLDKHHAYYVGLSDPEGKEHWQWVDQTPYNQSATFWHPGEPNNRQERCAILSAPGLKPWGLNDISCTQPQRSICKMMKIYL